MTWSSGGPYFKSLYHPEPSYNVKIVPCGSVTGSVYCTYLQFLSNGLEPYVIGLRKESPQICGIL